MSKNNPKLKTLLLYSGLSAKDETLEDRDDCKEFMQSLFLRVLRLNAIH